MTNWSIAYCVASDRCWRFGHQQHLDVRVDHLRIGWHWFHVVGLPQQRGGRIGLPGTARRPCVSIIMRGSPSNGSDDMTPTTGRFGIGQLVDQLGQVVFQKAFALWLEERRWSARHLPDCRRPGRNKPASPTLIERHALQPVGQRVVLGVAERLGIIELQLDLAV